MAESPGLSAFGREEPSANRKSTPIRRSNTLLSVLLVGLILLAVAGLALLGAYFFLSGRQAQPLSWSNPIDAVRPASVAPDLAVLSLAGEPDDRVVRAALDAGELETAHAALAYSALLSDAARSGHWALLAGRYNGTPADTSAAPPPDAARAALAYQALLDQASLSPGLGDVTRAGLSLQVARGMKSLGHDAVARLALMQAENIARYSLTLLPAQRREVLEQVVEGYRSIGDRQSASALQEQISSASAGPGVKMTASADQLSGLRGSVVLSADVTAALLARQQAAASLAARWLSASPTERDDLAAALGSSLKDEDAARSSFYDQAGDLSTADRLALLHDRINWVTIKYRVARQGYGVSLVPEWESLESDISAQLATAYTDLVNGYGLQLDTLEPIASATGRLQLLQEALMWTRLGLFPDHAEPALRTQLIEAARQLWTRRGGAGLVIVDQENQGRHFYLLSGSNASQGAQPTENK